MGTLRLMEQARTSGAWNAQVNNDGSAFDLEREMSSRISSATFVEIRNLLLMTIIPKRIHVKDELHAAYLKAAIVRVRYLIYNQYNLPTILIS